MIILGIDPGYAILGWGVVEKTGNRFRDIAHGAVTTHKDMDMPERPEVASIEKLYFNTNTTTAINVGQARGVAVLACIKGGVKVAEYTPLEIKQALTGYGRADKKQMQFMVRTMLNLREVPKPDDTADALAAAICHGHSADTRMILK